MKFPGSLSCICVAIFCFLTSLLAGAEGFEPPKAVLETAGLPLAYAPKQSANYSLLYFLVRLMLAAQRAEFVEREPLGFSLLVLGLAIVLSLALSALQRYD